MPELDDDFERIITEHTNAVELSTLEWLQRSLNSGSLVDIESLIRTRIEQLKERQ